MFILENYHQIARGRNDTANSYVHIFDNNLDEYVLDSVCAIYVSLRLLQLFSFASSHKLITRKKTAKINTNEIACVLYYTQSNTTMIFTSGSSDPYNSHIHSSSFVLWHFLFLNTFFFHFWTEPQYVSTRQNEKNWSTFDDIIVFLFSVRHSNKRNMVKDRLEEIRRVKHSGKHFIWTKKLNFIIVFSCAIARQQILVIRWLI